MKKKLILFFIIIELAMISLIGFNIYRKQKAVLGAVSITPIKKDDLIISQAGELKYFYEPKPNSMVTKKEGWLPQEYGYTITINADSLNERFDYPIEKPQDIFRILTLGDSHTYGLYVNTNENYPEKLEDLLNKRLQCQAFKKFEVINLGMIGYDIPYSIERLRLRGKKYNPDLVLWFLKGDDFKQNSELMFEKNSLLEKQMKESGEFELLQKKGDFYPVWNRTAWLVNKEYGEKKIIDIAIASLYTTSKFYNKDLVIFSPPFLENGFKSIIKDFVETNRMKYFYTTVSNIYSDEHNYLLDRHPSPKGYSIIANDLFAYLINNNIIPCN